MSPQRHALVAAALVCLVTAGAPIAILTARPSAADEPAPSQPTSTATATQVPTGSISATPSAPPPTTSEPTTEPTPTAPPTAQPTAPPVIAIDDAVLAWGVNDESNNKAFAPGTFNFLSAGAVPDPGKGGQSIVAPGRWRGTTATAWRAQQGTVLLQKQRADGSYGRATFAGLSTSASGAPLTSTAGPFSQHRVVIDAGTGTVDPAAGTARIEWTGTFSVVYYSGFTFFTVTDPTLVVTPESAQLRATVAGYAADRDDPERWAPVPAARVVLADLSELASSGLPPAAGFVTTPDYRGVRHDAPRPGVEQVRSGAAWGAFPASFLAYMDRVGSAAFWYSTGGAADPHKVPAPLAVAYDSGAVAPPEPTEGPQPPAEEPPPPAPSPTTTVLPTPPPAPGQSAPPPPPPAPQDVGPPSRSPLAPPDTAPSIPSQGDPSQAAPGQVTPSQTATIVALTDVASATRTAHRSLDWRWWVGGLMLLLAGSLTSASTRPRRRKAG